MSDGNAAAVQAECDRRLHVLNRDFSPTGSTYFDHLFWALSLLRHFHNQEERLGGDEVGSNHGASEAAVGQTAKRKAESDPSVAEDEEDTEMENSGAEKIAHPKEHNSPLQPNDTSASEGTKSDPGQERHKSDLNERNVDSLEEVVRRADSGKTGIRMAQIVGIWIGRRQCHALVRLISHCLCESLNQVSPFKSLGDDIMPSTDPGVQSTTESLWLHKWLVREVMQNTSTHRCPLDWLVAHLTAASPSLFLGAVIDDLWENVMACSANNSMASLSIYVRRIGVLEYAALRGSEQVAVELQRIFSNMGFVGSLKGENDLQPPHPRKRLVEMWSMWLVTGTLCPKFLAACSRYWIPCLSVKSFESCSSLFVDVIDVGSPLTSLWFILEGVNQEEPKRLSAWLSAILSRRICELAPVGTGFILLLNRLIGLSNTEERLEKGSLEVATSLLQRVYMDLSMRILPRVIGTEQTVGAEPLSFNTKDEYTGYSLFIDNLKMNLKKLWAELLSECSQSLGRAVSPDTKDLKLITGDLKPGLSDGRGWWNGDPFVGVCRITILSSGHYAVAELLAEETVAVRSDRGALEEKSTRRLFFVMEVMKLVAGQGRGVQVLEIWSQLCVASCNKSDDEKAFQRALAIKQLLDPTFWQSHQNNWMPSSTTEPSPYSKEENESRGIAWKVVWTLLRKVMDSQWLHLMPLLQRRNAWELHLVVLFILQSLPPGSDSHPQAVVVRLKALLAIFFQLVDAPQVDKMGNRWQQVQVLEHLKQVIVQQAVSSFASFTVMVSSLLDYSFEQSDRKAETSLFCNNKIPQRRGVSASGRGFFPTSTLVPGRLDQSGSFTLLSVPPSKEQQSSLASPKFSLADENRRMKSVGLPSLDSRPRQREDLARPPVQAFGNDGMNEDVGDTTIMELGDLLRRTVGRAVAQSADDPDGVWSPHPAHILASQMQDRLGTPHELAMTMEQYEEVLPKQVSAPRHIFLTECFDHNPLLFEMLELVVKYRESDEVLGCVEFIRVLLVDSISRWHSTYRTRRNPGLPPPRGFKEERLDRMHVIRLINLVADAQWLPQPLASTIEIIEIIDSADVADLLLLVWRCMHHAMTFGNRSWGGSSDPVVAQSGAPAEKAQSQGMEGGSGRDGTYTEWEGHLFAILRQNIAQIGAHFAQVYPKHDTL